MNLVMAAVFVAGLVFYILGRARPGVYRQIGRMWQAQALVIGVLGVLGLAATGRVSAAIVLALVLVGLVRSGIVALPNILKGGAPPRAGAAVRETRMLRVEMAGGPGGRLTGVVLAGQFKGQSLDRLDAAQLMALHLHLADDAESRALLEAYLDRRMPRWREHMERETASRRRRSADAGAMGEQEAYEILGLQPGAGEAEIRAAHRRLMKKVHPDQGGSTFLAVRLNQARDRLLSKHHH